MTEPDATPDPVSQTAPQAPPAPDHPAGDDEYVDGSGEAVLRTGTGTVPLPPTPGRAGG